MEKNNGGPAFPQGKEEWHSSIPEGMSLRDYFAGQALMGNISSNAPGYEFNSHENLATQCYLQADAMLKARDA